MILSVLLSLTDQERKKKKETGDKATPPLQAGLLCHLGWQPTSLHFITARFCSAQASHLHGAEEDEGMQVVLTSRRQVGWRLDLVWVAAIAAHWHQGRLRPRRASHPTGDAARLTSYTAGGGSLYCEHTQPTLSCVTPPLEKGRNE